MPLIEYKAKGMDGKVVEGRLRAHDEGAARVKLSRKGLEVQSISFLSENTKAPTEESKTASTATSFLSGFFKPVSTKQLREITSQLALLLETGTPLSQSLEALSEQADSDNVADFLAEIHHSVSGGATLTQALSEHPRVFGTFYISAVKAGEASGKLTDVFRRLEIDMAKREVMLGKLRGALIYPMVLLVLASCAVIFLVTVVLPKFSEMFLSSGVSMPGPTQFLMDSVEFGGTYWYAVIPGLVLPPILFVMFCQSARGKPLYDRAVFSIPVVGGMTRTVQCSAFMRILSTLLGSGVPLLESLGVAQEACTNLEFRKAVKEMELGVLRGESFSHNLSKSDLFSPSLKQMIATGEKTGSLAKVMSKLADYLDDQAQSKMQKMTTLFEPLIIIVMGGLVGFIVVSLVMALFKMNTVVNSG